METLIDHTAIGIPGSGNWFRKSPLSSLPDRLVGPTESAYQVYELTKGSALDGKVRVRVIDILAPTRYDIFDDNEDRTAFFVQTLEGEIVVLSSIDNNHKLGAGHYGFFRHEKSAETPKPYLRLFEHNPPCRVLVIDADPSLSKDRKEKIGWFRKLVETPFEDRPFGIKLHSLFSNTLWHEKIACEYVALPPGGVIPGHTHTQSNAFVVVLDGFGWFDCHMADDDVRVNVGRGCHGEIVSGTPHGVKAQYNKALEFISIQLPPIDQDYQPATLKPTFGVNLVKDR